jgi:hypothetical protein
MAVFAPGASRSDAIPTASFARRTSGGVMLGGDGFREGQW